MMFEVGGIFLTAGVAVRKEKDDDFANHVQDSFRRYIQGDWGDLDSEDVEMNNSALENGDRILACYEMKGDDSGKIWIITEWDRSTTTILFPDEY